MTLFQIIILAIVQGLAELLPVSSSAHVIIAQKLMGIDPSAPEMTFFLVMLHTGTMFAVLVYFWKRWAQLLKGGAGFDFVKKIIIATVCTGVLGFALKHIIEKQMGVGEVENLFRVLPLMCGALFVAGIFIITAGMKKDVPAETRELSTKNSIIIGLVQGLCLPFRGLSRSGVTISASMLGGVSRVFSEEFSFALAVVLTPPVILLELRRLLKAQAFSTALITPGLLGMIFSFAAGLVALKWLSKWLEQGKWKYFGYYCILVSAAVFLIMRHLQS